ncbi:MAG TPA: zinc ribbon domain-containing protein [Candidatus Bathyarchaeia archaeon]
MNSKSIVFISLLLCLALLPVHAFATFVPRQGDNFTYYEVIDVGSGTGDYTGYTDHTVVTGTENVNGVTADGIVSAHYSYAWDFSSNDGSTDSGASSGNFTFSSDTFLYINGTDDQIGYVNPTVWFCIDNSIPEGGTFYLLNTLMTVSSSEYSYFLPSENRNVYAIYAQGNSNWQRDDEYGQFTATYTWNTYFDPTSGYIIGYDYTEHNTNPSGTGFTYTEKLYITSASYQLKTAPPPRPNIISELLKYAAFIFVILIVVGIILIVYALSRNRRRLPRHPTQRPVYTPPSEQPPPQGINLTPKQAPVQQIVIKEVVKVNCRYCGALIDTTVEKCPYCGAPRR